MRRHFRVNFTIFLVSSAIIGLGTNSGSSVIFISADIVYSPYLSWDTCSLDALQFIYFIQNQQIIWNFVWLKWFVSQDLCYASTVDTARGIENISETFIVIKLTYIDFSDWNWYKVD